MHGEAVQPVKAYNRFREYARRKARTTSIHDNSLGFLVASANRIPEVATRLARNLTEVITRLVMHSKSTRPRRNASSSLEWVSVTWSRDGGGRLPSVPSPPGPVQDKRLLIKTISREYLWYPFYPTRVDSHHDGKHAPYDCARGNRLRCRPRQCLRPSLAVHLVLSVAVSLCLLWFSLRAPGERLLLSLY